ncbi:MAG: cupin domain-containing protein [Actinomycetota bacterium]|nr:cupin domain-containing protein [Actinomycetota bacterium]
MTDRIRIYGPDDLVDADPTSGIQRQRAFAVDGLWAGRVVTPPGAVSGWHHHDLNESSLYVVSGILRLECEGVEGYVDAEPGDFVQVPSLTIHRESNPTGEASVVVIARAGTGIPTVNVGLPPPPHR